FGHERAPESEQRREEDRDPEQAARLQPRRAPRQREVEDDEDRRDEEDHRRQGVPRPQLEQEVLAGQGSDVAEVAHAANARRALAKRTTRPGSWVAKRNVRSPRSAASGASRSLEPASSSALYGSSRMSSSGSWRRTRHR